MLPSRAGACVREPAIVSPALTPSAPRQPNPASSTLCQIPVPRSAPASPGAGSWEGGMVSSIVARPGAEASTRLVHHLILFYSPLSASLHTTAVLFIAPSCSLGVLPASSPPQPCSLHASSPGQGRGGDARHSRGPCGGSGSGEHGLRRKADH